MPRPKGQGLQTREKILDVAQELFTDRGYAETSLRDIAQRLGITKAALYYYFERKEDILLELHLRLHEVGKEMLDELEAIDDGPDRAAAWPHLLDQLLIAMLEHRDLILLHYRNQSAMQALHDDQRNRLENEDMSRRLIRILGSPAIPVEQRVRMACSIGAITEVFAESGPAFADVSPGHLADLVRAELGVLFGVTASG